MPHDPTRAARRAAPIRRTSGGMYVRLAFAPRPEVLQGVRGCPGPTTLHLPQSEREVLQDLVLYIAVPRRCQARLATPAPLLADAQTCKLQSCVPVASCAQLG